MGRRTSFGQPRALHLLKSGRPWNWLAHCGSGGMSKMLPFPAVSAAALWMRSKNERVCARCLREVAKRMMEAA